MATAWQDRFRRLVTASLSDLNPFRRDESFVAVDIGSSAIKLIEVRSGGGGAELVAWGSTPTPTATIQSNMVTEPDRVGDALRALVEGKGVRTKKALMAVPGPAVMIKRVTLPAQGPQELARTIMVEAGNFIPEELENVNIDHQVIDTRADGKEMEVLVVAAKKDIVSSYAETLRVAGLSPVVADVDYFALDNLFELNYDPAADQVVALVNIGGRYSSINILKGGRSTFTGDVPVGGRDITEALSRDLGVAAEEAERLKTGKGGAAFDAERLAAALVPAVDALVEEIHYALSFFWTAATDERIDEVYLSGGAAQTPELAQRLGARIEAPVELTDPFRRVALGAVVDAAALQRRRSEFAVALGLTLRRPGDK